jgi:hypothetical protein
MCKHRCGLSPPAELSLATCLFQLTIACSVDFGLSLANCYFGVATGHVTLLRPKGLCCAKIPFNFEVDRYNGQPANNRLPLLCCAKIPFSFEVDRYNGQPANKRLTFIYALLPEREPTVPPGNLEISDGTGVIFPSIILAHAHFSHDTPRIFGLDLPVACFPRAREPGSTSSNRRAPQVCRKAPKIDLGRPPAVDLSVALLARLALGVGHRQARNSHCLASCRLSFVLDLEGGRCVAENQDDPSFQEKSEI